MKNSNAPDRVDRHSRPRPSRLHLAPEGAGGRASDFRDQLDVLISGQIALMRGNEQVSMSKRAGNIETLDDILDEVGNDAARFFFVMLSPESPLTFDLALAVARNDENPVYYVQYGHARIASVLRNAGADDSPRRRNGASRALVHPTELALIRRLVEFPRVVEGVARPPRAAPARPLRARRRLRFPRLLHRVQDPHRRCRRRARLD